MSAGLFGPGWPPPRTEEQQELRRILWRRRLFWGLLCGTIPVWWFCSDVRWIMGAWFGALILSLGWHNLSRCPRCGERFNVGTLWGIRGGIPFAPMALSAQACVHCGFPLRPAPLRLGDTPNDARGL